MELGFEAELVGLRSSPFTVPWLILSEPVCPSVKWTPDTGQNHFRDCLGPWNYRLKKIFLNLFVPSLFCLVYSEGVQQDVFIHIVK